jgi:hypothetical protein
MTVEEFSMNVASYLLYSKNATHLAVKEPTVRSNKIHFHVYKKEDSIWDLWLYGSEDYDSGFLGCDKM